jgi:small subunit ribosomal protein S9
MPSKAKTPLLPKLIAYGRRREAMAVAQLVAGSGQITVNGVAVERFFPMHLVGKQLLRPLEVTETLKKYNISLRTRGGGRMGQLGAAVLAIARELVKINPSYKTPLRQNGLLTRDSRTRQRRMVGTGGKSRRQKQSPKR